MLSLPIMFHNIFVFNKSKSAIRQMTITIRNAKNVVIASL